jgi:hypothetical protein
MVDNQRKRDIPFNSQITSTALWINRHTRPEFCIYA